MDASWGVHFIGALIVIVELFSGVIDGLINFRCGEKLGLQL
jgi:hypothetical protein